jgi:hypothetical protein
MIMSTIPHNLVPDIDASEPWPEAPAVPPPAPTITPDAQTFRAIVAEVAARAKERLPERINGRLEGAVRLVLAHDVTRLEDGTIAVGSCTDPLKTYHLVGTTCECQDFPRAPEGWCRHRIAAGIDKRVREVLPLTPQTLTAAPAPPPPPPVAAPAPPLPEAPVSITLKATLDGHEVLVTLRGLFQMPACLQAFDENTRQHRQQERVTTCGGIHTGTGSCGSSRPAWWLHSWRWRCVPMTTRVSAKSVAGFNSHRRSG